MKTFIALEHVDVRGKKLHYLKLTNGKDEIIINVGEGTYQKAKKLLDEETTDTGNTDKPTEEKTNSKGNKQPNIPK